MKKQHQKPFTHMREDATGAELEMDLYERLAEADNQYNKSMYCYTHYGHASFDKSLLPDQSVSLNPKIDGLNIFPENPNYHILGGNSLKSSINQKMIDEGYISQDDDKFHFLVKGDTLYVGEVADLMPYLTFGESDNDYRIDFDKIREDGFSGINYHVEWMKDCLELMKQDEIIPDEQWEIEAMCGSDIQEHQVLAGIVTRVGVDAIMVWDPEAIYEVHPRLFELINGEYDTQEMQQWIAENHELVQQAIDDRVISFGTIVQAMERDVEKIKEFTPSEREKESVQRVIKTKRFSREERDEPELGGDR